MAAGLPFIESPEFDLVLLVYQANKLSKPVASRNETLTMQSPYRFGQNQMYDVFCWQFPCSLLSPPYRGGYVLVAGADLRLGSDG